LLAFLLFENIAQELAQGPDVAAKRFFFIFGRHSQQLLQSSLLVLNMPQRNVLVHESVSQSFVGGRSRALESQILKSEIANWTGLSV
jgi:hypothetical protein